MSQAPKVRITRTAPALPSHRKTVTPKQQIETSKNVDQQAVDRIQLGLKLFKAAQAHATRQQKIIEKLKSQQEDLRQEIQKDITSSLQTYDQWMAQFDQRFTAKILQLGEKIDAMKDHWVKDHKKIETMIRRAESLLDQTKYLFVATAKRDQAARSNKNRVSKTTQPAIPQQASKPTIHQQRAKQNEQPYPHAATSSPQSASSMSKRTSSKNEASLSTAVTSTAHEKTSKMIYSKALEQLRQPSASPTEGQPNN